MEAYEAGETGSSRKKRRACVVLFLVLYPQSTQELARIRYADLIREATQERLADFAHDSDVDQPEPDRWRALHWVASVARGVGARPAVARTT